MQWDREDLIEQVSNTRPYESALPSSTPSVSRVDIYLLTEPFHRGAVPLPFQWRQVTKRTTESKSKYHIKTESSNALRIFMLYGR